MKPNDKAIEAAIRYLEAPMSAREQMEQILTVAYAAQFQSKDYAGLMKELREDVLQFDLKDTAYENIAKHAADALEAVLAERDALKAELAAGNEWIQARAKTLEELAMVRAERDALLARLAPVDDKELVEIAADAISTYVPDQVSRWGSIKDAAIDATAAIRPHIEAAERERIKSKLREIDAASRAGGIFTLDSIIAEIDAPPQSGAGNE